MCGIAGIFERDTDNTQLMLEMLATIKHRGPDDQSIYTYRDFTLGHRRLSIIDVSTCGNQPIFNEDKSICVIFNGEIYNYEEIREELTYFIPLPTRKFWFIFTRSTEPGSSTS